MNFKNNNNDSSDDDDNEDFNSLSNFLFSNDLTNIFSNNSLCRK